MKKHTLTSVVLVVVSLGISTNFCFGFTIGLDAVHGPEGTEQLGVGSWYAQMRANLSTEYSIQILDDFSPATLALCDAIFVTQARYTSESFTAQEITDIHAFVESGKGLLAIAEGGYSSDNTAANFNSLLSPYGVTVNSSATMGSGLVVSGFVYHPITDGISEVKIDYHRCFINIVNPAIDLTIGSGESNILAVVDGVGGAGNVVILSDPSPFGYPGDDTSIYQYNNLRLLMNISDYIIPEPCTVLLLGLGGLLIRKR